MKRLLPFTAAALALFASCNGKGYPEYDNNDLELITGYTAKELCSCLFVLEQTDAFCAAWTRASPEIASVKVDHQQRTVEASALFAWGAKARHVDARRGCVLE